MESSDQLARMRKHSLAPKLKYPVSLRDLVPQDVMQSMKIKIIEGCHKCGGVGMVEDVDAGVMVRCDCVYKWNYEVGLLASNIPPRYYDITLATLDPEWIAENTTISLKVEKMITNFSWYESRGWGFHFVGSPGTGKTAVACALGKDLLTQGRTVYYTTLTDLVNRCFRRKDDTYEEGILKSLVGGVDLLILDEIDKLSNPEHPVVKGFLDEYFGLRYNYKRPTIIISKDIELEFEVNLIERFGESVTPLYFHLDDSYRKKLAERRKADEDQRPED